MFSIVNKSLAGSKPLNLDQDQSQGVCVYVTTGAPVPENFEAVIPIENV